MPHLVEVEVVGHGRGNGDRLSFEIYLRLGQSECGDLAETLLADAGKLVATASASVEFLTSASVVPVSDGGNLGVVFSPGSGAGADVGGGNLSVTPSSVVNAGVSSVGIRAKVVLRDEDFRAPDSSREAVVSSLPDVVVSTDFISGIKSLGDSVSDSGLNVFLSLEGVSGHLDLHVVFAHSLGSEDRAGTGTKHVNVVDPLIDARLLLSNDSVLRGLSSDPFVVDGGLLSAERLVLGHLGGEEADSDLVGGAPVSAGPALGGGKFVPTFLGFVNVSHNGVPVGSEGCGLIVGSGVVQRLQIGSVLVPRGSIAGSGHLGVECDGGITAGGKGLTGGIGAANDGVGLLPWLPVGEGGGGESLFGNPVSLLCFHITVEARVGVDQTSGGGSGGGSWESSPLSINYSHLWLPSEVSSGWGVTVGCAKSGLTSGDPAVLTALLIILIQDSDALLLSGCDILDEGGDVGVELAGNGGEVDNGLGGIFVLALPGLVVNSVGNGLRGVLSERVLQASVGSARSGVGQFGPGL